MMEEGVPPKTSKLMKKFFWENLLLTSSLIQNSFDVTKTQNKRNKPVTSGTTKEQVSNKRNNQGTSQ